MTDHDPQAMRPALAPTTPTTTTAPSRAPASRPALAPEADSRGAGLANRLQPARRRGKLIYEGVLAPKREAPHDSLRSVGEHVVALAHRHALQQVQQSLSEAGPSAPPINARKPPGTH